MTLAWEQGGYGHQHVGTDPRWEGPYVVLTLTCSGYEVEVTTAPGKTQVRYPDITDLDEAKAWVEHFLAGEVDAPSKPD